MLLVEDPIEEIPDEMLEHAEDPTKRDIIDIGGRGTKRRFDFSPGEGLSQTQIEQSEEEGPPASSCATPFDLAMLSAVPGHTPHGHSPKHSFQRSYRDTSCIASRCKYTCLACVGSMHRTHIGQPWVRAEACGATRGMTHIGMIALGCERVVTRRFY